MKQVFRCFTVGRRIDTAFKGKFLKVCTLHYIQEAFVVIGLADEAAKVTAEVSFSMFRIWTDAVRKLGQIFFLPASHEPDKTFVFKKLNNYSFFLANEYSINLVSKAASLSGAYVSTELLKL